MRHENLDECLSCAEKLKSAHPYFGAFVMKVRQRWPDVHVSWSFRNQKEQQEAFDKGASKFVWPESKHNMIPSQAIDLFQQDAGGRGIWSYPKMKEIQDSFGDHLVWGGNWTNFKDFYHWELPEHGDDVA